MTTKPDPMPAGTTAAVPAVLLGHHLKQLKLPTILREYEKVARECARDGIDHPGYLLRLVELELIDRERRVTERRIREARFPAVKSLDTFEFTAIPNATALTELVRHNWGNPHIRYRTLVAEFTSAGQLPGDRALLLDGLRLAGISD
jgi:hypothetical protein